MKKELCKKCYILVSNTTRDTKEFKELSKLCRTCYRLVAK